MFGISPYSIGLQIDIQDRVARRGWGLPSDPFYTLAQGERLEDHREEPNISIFAAFLYLEDRWTALGGNWKAGVA